MTDSVFEALTPIAMTREAEKNAKIVMLMKAGLAETKHCRNEQQRQEFHIGLSYVMPPREGERSSTGWIRRICEQLDVQRGNRMDGRARATNQAVATCGYADQLQRIACRWFQAQGSASSST